MEGLPENFNKEQPENIPLSDSSDKKFCKNCQSELNGNFCSFCGQKADTHRINFKFLLHEIQHGVFHVDKGILFTLKELFTRPGKMINGYLQGKRVSHFKPVALVFILGTLVFLEYHLVFKTKDNKGVVNFKTSDTLSGEDKENLQKILKFVNVDSSQIVKLKVRNDSILEAKSHIGEKQDKISDEEWDEGFDYERGKKYGEFIKKWGKEHPALLLILFLPIGAFSLYLSFFKYRKQYNYAEYLVIFCFLSAQIILVQMIAIPISYFTGFKNIFIWISIGIGTWSLFELFNKKTKKRYIILRLALGFFYAFMLTVITIALITTFIALIDNMF